jgi:hypothetical protein
MFQFSCTKSVQNLTVPLGYNYMYVDMSGASSGSRGGGNFNGIPGFGARVQSSFTVVPGIVLRVTVGCQGISCPSSVYTPPTSIAGGYNGGGAGFANSNFGGTGGGGASDIRIGGMSLTDRVMMAGGGGGFYCGNECGLLKGGDGGKYGNDGSLPSSACAGTGHHVSGGGNWTSGGSAAGSVGSPNPTRGSLGFGGNGGYANSGGGGGGYYGGGTTNLFWIRF